MNCRLHLLALEARDVPSGGRLFALSEDGTGRVAVYEATGPSLPPEPTNGGAITGVYRLHFSGSGRLLATIDAFPGFGGGAHTAVGDVTGDGVDDLVVAAGAGGGPHVKVFDGQALLDGRVSLVTEFYAFGADFHGGAYVAVGQVDLTSPAAEIIVGAGAGGGAHVKVIAVNTGRTQLTGEFVAYDPSFRGGVRVAAADTTGDGRVEIITAAGPGGGPHVRIFDVGQLGATVVDEFFAYDLRFAGGVSVAARELDGDPTRAEIVTGPCAGGQPIVRLWGTPADGQYAKRAELLVGDPTDTAGLRVGVGNLDLRSDRLGIYVGRGQADRFKAPPAGDLPESYFADGRMRAFVADIVRSPLTSMYYPAGPTAADIYFSAEFVDLPDGLGATPAGGLNNSG